MSSRRACWGKASSTSIPSVNFRDWSSFSNVVEEEISRCGTFYSILAHIQKPRSTQPIQCPSSQHKVINRWWRSCCCRAFHVDHVSSRRSFKREWKRKFSIEEYLSADTRSYFKASTRITRLRIYRNSAHSIAPCTRTSTKQPYGIHRNTRIAR